MTDKLRPKQEAFVDNYTTNGGNGTQAVIDAGYDVKSRTNAAVVASENLTKPNIINAIKSIAEQIPDELLVEKHLQLLNSEEDSTAVSKGLDMAYKIKGTYAPEKTQSINLNINTTDEKALEIANKYEQELKKGL